MATNGQPATPPPAAQQEAAAAPTTTSPKPQQQQQSSQQQQQFQQQPQQPLPEVPLTSTQDDGLSKRPRDARLIHLVLNSQGIYSYQERVPLQLLDFAYRYTSGVLSDSLRLSAEGYHIPSSTTTGSKGKSTTTGDDSGNITVTALRQAIASRQGYAFQGALPKEFMMQQASQRNLVALPRVEKRGFGVQLPAEEFCLTGTGWGLREGWESDEEDEEGDVRISGEGEKEGRDGEVQREDERMGGMDGADGEVEDEEGAGRMEDVFGGDEGGDTNMGQD